MTPQGTGKARVFTERGLTAQEAAALSRITTAHVRQAYSGKPGCGCGCNGTYSTSGLNVARILGFVRKNATQARIQSDGNEVIVSVETETRYRWLYLRKG